VGQSRVPSKLAVLTSGGDAAGMNAAVRAVVRTGLAAGLDVFAVYEGLQGLVDGGDRITPMTSPDVSGILHVGGTVLGTARSQDFRTREGRRRAALNLVERDIDGLVVIGGDGSLTGTDVFREEWPELLDELVTAGLLDPDRADEHRRLWLVGIVGSIDNDMSGTDMTIGADTALHRIVEAVDAIQSTASSHQRTFVIEVMGRRCGYLALMGGLATGANFVLIPENPPSADWKDAMCDVLSGGRTIGRRANIVLVAEGTTDVDGNSIAVGDVKQALEERLGEDARITILGHVQRGGSPSAFDRYMGTVMGYAAVKQLLERPDDEPQLIGIQGHRVVSSPLMDCVAKTQSIAEVIANGDPVEAMQMRGGSFTRSHELLRTIVRARPRRIEVGERRLRLAVLHGGGPVPGMNTAVRIALRVAMDRGHTLLGAHDGFRGLLDSTLEEMGWMSVSGWVSEPGAELGTDDFVPDPEQAAHMARQLAIHHVDGLLMIGGWAGYEAALALSDATAGAGHPWPIVCVPASVSNNLPATDMSIGADSALNSIVSDVDKIKEAAMGNQIDVVEVMGKECGFLALVSGMATGAELVYVPEEGLSLRRLQDDLATLQAGFECGKRRGLVVRGGDPDAFYTTKFIEDLFEHESDGLFDVRSAILGQVQRGGHPSPFDRIHATRLTAAAVEHLIAQAQSEQPDSAMVGLRRGRVEFTPLADFPKLVDPTARRPRKAGWWMALRPIADTMATAPTAGPRERR
jgi:6-phosphofructokinase 1